MKTSARPESATPRSSLTTYGISLAVLAAALLLRYALDSLLGGNLPFITIFGAVAAAVSIGGLAPAVLVTGLGYLGCLWLFADGAGTGFDALGRLTGLTAFLFTNGLIMYFGIAARAARAEAQFEREALRVTLRSIGDAVITTDTAARVTMLNPIAERLTGWTPQDAVGHSLDEVFQIVNESTRAKVENPAQRALNEGAIVGLANHTVLISRDRRETAIDDSAAPIVDSDGRTVGSVLVFRDVTARRELERARASELKDARLLAAIVESSDDAIISKTLSGRILSWNAGAERLFGHEAGDAIGKHISLVIPPERLSEEDKIISELTKGRRIEHFETERVRADGTLRHVSLTISPIHDDHGQVIGASKIARDITERRLEEEKRRRAEEERALFAKLVESSPDFIGIADLEGHATFVNRAGLEMVGLDSLEQARRTPVRDFFFPEDQSMIIDEFFPLVLKNGFGEVEVRFRHFKTGEARWMAYKVLVLHGPDGNAVALATVSQDVTERKRLNENLSALAFDLSEADRRKNEFLAMLAHELRNPLSPISNAAQTLRHGVTDPSTLQRSADMLVRQVGQMSRLLDDLLDMSRVSRGRIELRKERVDLRAIIEHTVDAHRAQFASHQQEFQCSIPDGALMADADPARVAQIVGNLLNNAGKFTDHGGRITLKVEAIGRDAVITVADTGIGIAREHLSRLFDLFAQVDTSLERAHTGLGIGLTLVKSLVEMHGGSVVAKSEGLGRGSEFVVKMPLAPDGARPPEPVEATVRRHASKRILVVDDSVDGAASMAMLLQLEGHDTREAYDGPEALRMMEEWRPDVVLLDIGLPGLNGYEVCRRARREPWGANITIVALTGWGQEEDRAKSQDAGFDAHLLKPVLPDALLAFLNSI